MKYEICMFPGQGSQHTGMGTELFHLFPQYVECANDILGYDIVDLCLHNNINLLQQTNYTQPALFVVNALSYLKHIQEKSIPDIVLGHSLGEFNALFAAGVFDFEAGLQLVQKRGQLMSNCVGGGMAAVIGLFYEEVEKILLNNSLDLDIANINSASQIVISGQASTIEQAAVLFEDEFATYITLKVSGAFHSRYMKSTQQAFLTFAEKFKFNSPEKVVISNVTALPHIEGSILDLLVEQITKPVKWYESISYLLERGECSFVELGPGKVLTNLLKGIKRS